MLRMTNFIEENCEPKVYAQLLSKMDTIIMNFQREWWKTNNQNIIKKIRLLKNCHMVLLSFYCDKEDFGPKTSKIMYVLRDMPKDLIETALIPRKECTEEMQKEYRKLWNEVTSKLKPEDFFKSIGEEFYEITKDSFHMFD